MELDSAISRSSILSMAILIAVRCCSCSTSWVIAAVTFGIAVPVAADPAAQQQRGRLGGELDAVLGHRDGEVVGQLRNGVGDDRLEVEQRVARLVDRRRPELPELVGLPDQVDDLGELAVLAVPGRPTRPASARRGCRTARAA